MGVYEITDTGMVFEKSLVHSRAKRYVFTIKAIENTGVFKSATFNIYGSVNGRDYPILLETIELLDKKGTDGILIDFDGVFTYFRVEMIDVDMTLDTYINLVFRELQ